MDKLPQLDFETVIRLELACDPVGAQPADHADLDLELMLTLKFRNRGEVRLEIPGTLDYDPFFLSGGNLTVERRRLERRHDAMVDAALKIVVNLVTHRVGELVDTAVDRRQRTGKIKAADQQQGHGCRGLPGASGPTDDHQHDMHQADR